MLRGFGMVATLTAGIVSAGTGCGASLRMVHQSDAYFERCHTAEYDSSVSRDTREQCWTVWLEHYRQGQPPDRVAYARGRVAALRAGETTEPLPGLDGAPPPSAGPSTTGRPTTGRPTTGRPGAATGAVEPLAPGAGSEPGLDPAGAEGGGGPPEPRQPQAERGPGGIPGACTEVCEPRHDTCVAACSHRERSCERACEVEEHVCRRGCY